MRRINIFILCICGILWGCVSVRISATLVPTQPEVLSPKLIVSMTSSPESTIFPTLTLIPPTASIIEPHGCARPRDDYHRIQVNGHWVNQRTFTMLEHAQILYGGMIDISGTAITQGHYTEAIPLSFGTHAGGGVVDLSVIDHAEWQVLYDEIEPLIYALRVAGFAAWLRDYGELSPGSPIHIHAVAIGDQELSPAAVEQLNGPFGYFRGYNGLPQDNGAPILDKHGGPILCQWMIEAGYRDLHNP